MFRNIFILCIVVIFLNGCVSTSQIRADNRERLINLSVGISKQEVLEIMGTETIRADNATIITNPYRTEMYRTGDSVFELVLYYTDLQKADGAITDDELTPIVVKDGVVDGWGWSYWNDAIQKYEIRVR
jgi:hypothetical protein